MYKIDRRGKGSKNRTLGNYPANSSQIFNSLILVGFFIIGRVLPISNKSSCFNCISNDLMFKFHKFDPHALEVNFFIIKGSLIYVDRSFR